VPPAPPEGWGSGKVPEEQIAAYLELHRKYMADSTEQIVDQLKVLTKRIKARRR